MAIWDGAILAHQLDHVAEQIRDLLGQKVYTWVYVHPAYPTPKIHRDVYLERVTVYRPVDDRRGSIGIDDKAGYWALDTEVAPHTPRRSDHLLIEPWQMVITKHGPEGHHHWIALL